MFRKLIHDCDNGLGLLASDVDDGLALLYVLARHDVDLLAVTTCFGNASLGRIHRATQWLLAYTGRSDLPLVPGARRSGMAVTPAARLLVEAATRFPGEVTVLATGPLTNLASAAALDPDFFAKLAGIVCIGGALDPAKLGWRAVNERNFACDPAAARQVLSASCPVTIVPASSCLAARFDGRDLDRLAHLGRPIGAALARWMTCCRIGRGVGYFVGWDLLPALWLFHPQLLTNRRATLSLISDAVLQADCGTAHTLVTGLADPVAFREAFFAGLATLELPGSGLA